MGFCRRLEHEDIQKIMIMLSYLTYLLETVSVPYEDDTPNNVYFDMHLNESYLSEALAYTCQSMTSSLTVEAVCTVCSRLGILNASLYHQHRKQKLATDCKH